MQDYISLGSLIVVTAGFVWQAIGRARDNKTKDDAAILSQAERAAALAIADAQKRLRDELAISNRETASVLSELRMHVAEIGAEVRTMRSAKIHNGGFDELIRSMRELLRISQEKQ